MPNFQVSVVIENKPGISDPEGDTILNDLVLKVRTHTSHKYVQELLKISITESNENAAKRFCSQNL